MKPGWVVSLGCVLVMKVTDTRVVLDSNPLGRTWKQESSRRDTNTTASGKRVDEIKRSEAEKVVSGRVLESSDNVSVVPSKKERTLGESEHIQKYGRKNVDVKI